jgi:citrate synthase
VERARKESLSIPVAASQAVEAALAAGRRVRAWASRAHHGPRVDVLFDMAAKRASPRGIAFVRGWKRPPASRSSPSVNVDGALAAVLYDLGFPPAAGQFVFMVGRVAGLTAEVAEEYAREKPMRIRIPVRYDGVPPRPME